ncbi:MAG: hypothetical protein IPJ77_06965 [Planctomycetes bacterium]|nr:hypothetical protein [Planctomycetota bacterium]
MKLARMDAVRLVLAIAAILAVWSGVRGAPFLSEDWTHLAEAARDASWRDAFDLAREPLRPLQHLVFHVLADSPGAPGTPGVPNATAARALSFALHAASALLVFLLALEAARVATRTNERPVGDGRAIDRAGHDGPASESRLDATAVRAASGAALLFALAPNVKGLAWTAAISTPGRACFVLAGLVLFARGLRRRSALDAALFIASFLLALAFHESAIVLPALCLAWAVFAPEASTRLAARARAAWCALKRPELALVVLATLAYVVYIAFLRPERHHGLKSFDSLPANAVKASLALFPELLRANVVAFLRAHPGAGGIAAAGALFAALGALAVWILRRGPFVARFALVAVAIDLVLPVLSTGFNQRYAYLGSAFAAVALAAWAATTWKPWTLFGVIVLGGAWAFDTLRDAEEYDEAGRVAQRIVDAACATRARTPATVPVAIVDAPDVWGAEDDIPVFNWGLLEALDRAGCGRAFVLWRTRPFHTGTDVELVTPERVRAADEGGEAVVLRADVEFPAFFGVRRAVER